MNDTIIIVAIAVVVGIVSFYLTNYFARRAMKSDREQAREETKKIIAEAENEAKIKKKEAVLEAREEWLKLKGDFEREAENRRRELDSTEKKLDSQQSSVQKKLEFLDVREREMANRDKNLQARDKGITFREKQLDEIIAAQNEKLQKIAQMTPEEAKKQLMDNMIATAKMEAAAHIKAIKEKGEAQDEFYQKLDEAIRVDFSDEDVRAVARSLTFLTEINIIVDETVFSASNDALNPRVNIRTSQPWPLRTIITRMCQQTGLAYSIEDDHVFISTRVKLDEQK